MNGLLPVAALRFREALAGRMLWLLPLHFAIAFWIVRSIPGPTLEARLQAADATALGLAAVLALVAAAVMGASPLAAERLRPHGTLLLASAVSPSTRVLGTALGTGGALLLLVLGLCASAMAAVDLGVGGATGEPREVLRPVRIEGHEYLEETGTHWTDFQIWGGISILFPRRLEQGDTLILNPRNGRGPTRATTPAGEAPSDTPHVYRNRRGHFGFANGAFPLFTGEFEWAGSTTVDASLKAPLRVEVPKDCDFVHLQTSIDFPRLGLRLEDVRLEGVAKPRALARGLHAAALLGGLLAVMGAGMAISTVTGGGVGAGGALTLALLALFQPLFADAADTLAYAGAMERTIQATLSEGQEAVALTGTPPAMAPVFRAIASVLPDGTRFDLASAVATNEIPWSGEALRTLAFGAALCAAFLVVAILGARRRP